MTDTNELRKLLAVATPGPWTVIYRDDRAYWTVFASNLPRKEVFDDGSACGEYAPTCSKATRDLIVEAVNGLPAMLDELDALRAEVERLRNHIHSADTAAAVESGALRLSLKQVDDDVDALRDDLSEAMRLLQAHGEPPAWTFQHGAHFAASWSRRYGELFAKYKETP